MGTSLVIAILSLRNKTCTCPPCFVCLFNSKVSVSLFWPWFYSNNHYFSFETANEKTATIPYGSILDYWILFNEIPISHLALRAIGLTIPAVSLTFRHLTLISWGHLNSFPHFGLKPTSLCFQPITSISDSLATYLDSAILIPPLPSLTPRTQHRTKDFWITAQIRRLLLP